jgi:enediyne biosynthesis protein E4
LSESDRRVHFGLGSSARVDGLEIVWPSGAKERVGPIDANRFVTIKEGLGVVSQRQAK